MMAQRQKSLNEKAMLVDITCSIWVGRVKDRVVSDEVKTQKHADKDAGAWWTYLVPKEKLHPILNAQGRCRKAIREMTLPWDDSGMRILPAKMFLDYTKLIRKHTNLFNEAVEDFLKEYPKIKREASKRLGKLSYTKELPTLEEVRGKFSIRAKVLPLPAAGDFRVDLGNQNTKEVQKQIQQTLDNSMKSAMSDIWSRLSDLVEKIEEKMKDPKAVFRASLISNLTDFCELIPKLNITDNDDLEKIRKTVVDKLGKIDPDDVRKNKRARARAASDAKKVLSDLSSFKL